MKKLTTCMMLMTTLGLSTLTSLAYADDSQNFATAVSGDWTVCLDDKPSDISAKMHLNIHKISANEVEMTVSDRTIYSQPNCTGDIKETIPSLLEQFQNKATLVLVQPETKEAYTVAKTRLSVVPGHYESGEGIIALYKDGNTLVVQNDVLSATEINIKEGKFQVHPLTFYRTK